MKTSLEGLKTDLSRQRKRVSELENRTVEIIESEDWEEKRPRVLSRGTEPVGHHQVDQQTADTVGSP